MAEKMGEMLSLIQRAEKMEMVNEEISLGLYIKLFSEYEPQVAKPFDSAIRMLEKRDRLQEALDLANRAIDLIKKDQMIGQVNKYEEIQQRIERKMAEKGQTPVKEKKPSQALTLVALIGIILLIFGIVFLFATPYGRILVNLDGKAGLDGDIVQKGSSEEYKKYPITQKMIDFATKNIKREHEVKDAHILVQSYTLGIGIITNKNLGEDAKRIVKQYLDYLSQAAVVEYPELATHTEEELGQVLEFYDLVISVGTGVEESSIYVKGTKNVGTRKINYKE